jgi:hypothetical protein
MSRTSWRNKYSPLSRTWSITRHYLSRETLEAIIMRIAIFIAGLVALAYAAPYPQDSELPDDDEEPESISAPFPTPTIPAILTTSLNIPVTTINSEPGRPTTSRKPPHKEPIPIFSKACTCDIATVHYPCWATDALQVSWRSYTNIMGRA